MEIITATIYEQGNGFPDAGDYVQGDGQLYRIDSIDSRIQTGSPRGNSVSATLTEVSWDECEEGDEHSARVEIDDGIVIDRDA